MIKIPSIINTSRPLDHIDDVFAPIRMPLLSTVAILVVFRPCHHEKMLVRGWGKGMYGISGGEEGEEQCWVGYMGDLIILFDLGNGGVDWVL